MVQTKIRRVKGDYKDEDGTVITTGKYPLMRPGDRIWVDNKMHAVTGTVYDIGGKSFLQVVFVIEC
jgi:hypothetical protein